MTSRGWLRRIGLTQPVVIALVVLVLVATLAIAFLLQLQAERNALTPVGGGASVREQREIDKLNAEIKQIRSDTGGSLFWLKMAGLFVTVGAAVGGYLVGQSRNTRERLEAEQQVAQERLEFEHRQNIDTTYHSIVEELTVASPLLRAASAMKLGKLLQAPPVEWHLTPERERELGDLTEQILAAALAIETEPKVLKALTIALALHTPDSEAGDLRSLDLSGARAADAYWARIDFRYADFYRRADLTDASLRSAAAERAVPEASSGTPCSRTGRGRELQARPRRGSHRRRTAAANFEDVRVFGARLDGASASNPDCGRRLYTVDVTHGSTRSPDEPIADRGRPRVPLAAERRRGARSSAPPAPPRCPRRRSARLDEDRDGGRRPSPRCGEDSPLCGAAEPRREANRDASSSSGGTAGSMAIAPIPESRRRAHGVPFDVVSESVILSSWSTRRRAALQRSYTSRCCSTSESRAKPASTTICLAAGALSTGSRLASGSARSASKLGGGHSS